MVQNIRKNVLEKKLKSDDDDTGKRNIIIDSEVQIESLKQLLAVA